METLELQTKVCSQQQVRAIITINSGCRTSSSKSSASAVFIELREEVAVVATLGFPKSPISDPYRCALNPDPWRGQEAAKLAQRVALAEEQYDQGLKKLTAASKQLAALERQVAF